LFGQRLVTEEMVAARGVSGLVGWTALFGGDGLELGEDGGWSDGLERSMPAQDPALDSKRQEVLLWIWRQIHVTGTVLEYCIWMCVLSSNLRIEC